MASMLASQGKLTDLTNKFDGKTPVRIHFLDNSSKVFLVEKTTSVKDLVAQCLQKFGVVDPPSNLPYFGLFESKNGGNIDGSLDMEATISGILQAWEDADISQTAKFLFMIRLYMPCLWGFQHKDVVAFRVNKPKSMLSLDAYFAETEIVDVNCMQLQFIQAVYQIITGRYPTTIEQAMELGALHFLHKFGQNFDRSIHRPGFLGGRIVEFIPVKHLRGGSTTLPEWEDQLFDKIEGYVKFAERDAEGGDGNNVDDCGEHHKNVFFRRDEKPISPQRKYMEIVYSLESVYGNTFFRTTQHCSRALPDTVYLGIHHHGISLFDKSKKLVRMFHIEDIYRWGFKPNQMFYFEINEENDLGTGSLEFDTNEGKVVSDLLTDYAMAFLKEREREDERYEQMKSGTFDVEKTHSKANKVVSSAENDRDAYGKVSSNKVSQYYATGKVNGVTGSAAPPPPPSSKAPSQPPPPPGGSSSKASSTGSSSKPKYQSKEEKAAIRIQALARGVNLRTEWTREDAAILIQSIWRGYLARCLLSSMIEAMILKGELG